MLVVLFLIGICSGILTGMLSIGGGVILVAAMLIVPPLFGLPLSMKTVTGLSFFQAFFATVSGAIYYYRNKLLDVPIILYLGIPAMAGGAIGAYLANYMDDIVLKIIFAIVSSASALMMLFPAKNMDRDDYISQFSKPIAVMIGLSTGLLGGVIGLTAGFIFVPVMMYIFKLSVRKAIGSSLLTCFLVAVGGLAVKIGMQAVELHYAIALVSGGIVGSQLGGVFNKKVQTVMLKKMVAVIIVIISAKVMVDLF